MKSPNNVELEDLYYEVSILLEGVLYFAGVKKQNLQKAAEIYTQIIDDVLQNSQANGVDEVLEVVKFMKINHKELFE
ncbi:hypothetical protein F1B92_07325 [Campylobacter sp. FMV-PI01]|uniref:Cell division protein n=1 Tax=Campylobacter portucalensis TaxID=2608384 RepID=A0A6L5WIK3_9BACT|nr:hypothetical protein [Campylobacter portucalensis]MSN96969.1 hypothetical protein [Campylobacter portucalensis]